MYFEAFITSNSLLMSNEKQPLKKGHREGKGLDLIRRVKLRGGGVCVVPPYLALGFSLNPSLRDDILGASSQLLWPKTDSAPSLPRSNTPPDPGLESSRSNPPIIRQTIMYYKNCLNLYKHYFVLVYSFQNQIQINNCNICVCECTGPINIC